MKNTIVKTTPKDFFSHLLGFAALYAGIVSFLALVFSYIDFLWPDPLNFYYAEVLNQVRLSSSVLLVIFPVFILISWLIEKDFSQNPEKREIKFRKWLVYFTLFVAAITVIVDLVILIFHFYGGELTARFFYKVLAVLVVAGFVFRYYFWDLKRSAQTTGVSKKPKITAWISALVALSAVVAGFFIAGSPSQQRARRFDEQRVNDLQSIQYRIINYWQNKGKLPEKLSNLNDSISGFVVPSDPETQSVYEYTEKGLENFELCAEFKTDSGKAPSGQYMPREITPPIKPHSYQETWEHGTGKVCFARTIDPELYPRIK